MLTELTPPPADPRGRQTAAASAAPLARHAPRTTLPHGLRALAGDLYATAPPSTSPCSTPPADSLAAAHGTAVVCCSTDGPSHRPRQYRRRTPICWGSYTCAPAGRNHVWQGEVGTVAQPGWPITKSTARPPFREAAYCEMAVAAARAVSANLEVPRHPIQADVARQRNPIGVTATVEADVVHCSRDQP